MATFMSWTYRTSAKASRPCGTRGSPSTAPTAYKKPSYIPYDLNDAGDPDKATPLDILTSAGFSKERPTLFFCSKPCCSTSTTCRSEGLFQDLLLASTTSPDSAVVLTDNLKPLTYRRPSRTRRGRSSRIRTLILLKHGAVGRRGPLRLRRAADSQIYDQLVVDRQDTTVSYLPILSHGAAALQKKPTFENAWYAVAFSKQFDRQEGDDFDELGYDALRHTALRRAHGHL